MLDIVFDCLILTALFAWVPFERRGVVAPLVIAGVVLAVRLMLIIAGRHSA